MDAEGCIFYRISLIYTRLEVGQILAVFTVAMILAVYLTTHLGEIV